MAVRSAEYIVQKERQKYFVMATPGVVLSMACKKVYHLPSCLAALVTVGIQAYIVNHYLVSKYGEAWYSWYVADVVAGLIFSVAFVDSYRHMKNIRRSEVTKDLFSGKLGHLPFVYLSWFLYSVLLAVRIGIIFRYIAPSLDENLMYGPNMLKTGLSLSSIIFFLLVIAHVEAEPQTIVDQYVTNIVGRVTIDVLDSVQFLELLFINETKIFLSFGMHKAIITIGCINLILPTFKLAILSAWKFGEDNTRPKLFDTLYLVGDLLIVNVPLLVVRILLWSVHSQDVSVFIIKNVLSLCMSIKAVHDHCVALSPDDIDGAVENVQMDDLRHPVDDPTPQPGSDEDEARQHLNEENNQHRFV